jgi:hypothetical protein
MQMAKVFGLEVPFHGIYGRDGGLSYFTFWSIAGEGKNIPQGILLSGIYESFKYRFTMEKLIPVLVTERILHVKASFQILCFLT